MVEFNPESFKSKVDRINGLNSRAELIRSLEESDPQIGKKLGTKIPVLDEALEAMGLRQKPEPTQENLEAKAALNDKVSSTDIKYSDAEQTISNIMAQYNSDQYFDEVLVYPKDSEYLVHQEPRKVKVFNPDKLPEPAKTQFKEAIAAKQEIENNNSALVEQAGVAITPTPNLADNSGKFKIGGDLINRVLGRTSEPTERQTEARNKLGDKVSSTGKKYSEAKQVLDEIKARYENECTSEVKSEQPKQVLIHVMPHTEFDPYKLPEPAKTQYFEALEAVMEIEQQNSALVSQAGITPTPKPVSQIDMLAQAPEYYR